MPKQTPQRETQMTWWATLIFGWAIFLFWAVLAGPAPFLVRTRDLRRRTGALADATGGPTITVIIPARDEAAGIEANLRSLLASDYSDLEIVAVNDRSQDETGTIMERLAIEEGRLRVIHIQELPDGWLGKCHAMHLGAEAAHGELLLFTDGDVIFAPETIRRAAWYLQRTDTDHLCLMPHLIPGGYWESAFVSFFGMIFWMGTQPWLVPTSLKRAYVGVGAFNLVRKRVYDAIGGHTPIRLDVLDDVKLGKLIKNSGYRPDCLFAGELLRVRWQSSFWQSICGLEKNGFAAQDYSLVRMIALTITALTVGLVPYVGLVAFHDQRAWGFLAAAILSHVHFGWLGSLFGASWWIIPAFPVAVLSMLLAFWRSTVKTLRQGGVRWRETFYPLDELRGNIYK